MASKSPNELMKKRLKFLRYFVGIILFAVVGVRLYYLQVVEYKTYQEYAVNQQTKEITITPTRGTIYDRNMKELAISAPTEMVTFEPVNIDDGTEELIATEISEILGLEYDEVYEKATKDTSYVVVQNGVEKHITDQIRLFIRDEGISGVYMHEDSTRYYPYGSFASHIIGFIGTDGYGLAGIEASYNDILTGTPGKVVRAQNAQSTDMPYKYETYIEGEDGNSIVLTIDEVMQHFLEKHLEAALSDYEPREGVAGIIMDVKTGEILAMATKPDFDLNEPFTITDPKLLEAMALMETEEGYLSRSEGLEKMWRNKPIQDTYEPGSPFKVFTVATAYEESVVTANSTFTCTGHKVVGPHNISCWKTAGHGTQNLMQALQNSCNPSMMTMADLTGNTAFEKYYDGFGFYEKTGIDLPGEATGIFFAEEDFNTVQLATSSFGQGFQVTPIQMISMVSAIANDGKLMTPYLMKEVLDPEGNVIETNEPVMKRQVISAETSAYMRDALEAVVTDGTGSNAYVAGYHVGGKTGTSEKLPRGTDDRIASFIGIAPMDDPQIAVFVMIDEPADKTNGGGIAAAPLTGNIMADILPYMEIEPDYTESELSQIDVIVPNMVGKTAEEAKLALNSQDIPFETVGNGDSVTDQMPDSGAVIPNGAKIIIYLGEEKEDEYVTIPDLSGMSISRATNTINNSDIYIKMTGVTSGGNVIAVSQEPRAGERVPVGTVVTVRFADPTVGD